MLFDLSDGPSKCIALVLFISVSDFYNPLSRWGHPQPSPFIRSFAFEWTAAEQLPE